MYWGRKNGWDLPIEIEPVDRPWMMGACFTFQPGIVERAGRPDGEASGRGSDFQLSQ